MKRLSLLLLTVAFTSGILQAQKNIEGQILDSNSGEPLVGVNIKANGTSIGTVSDIDGNFELQFPDTTKSLVFSFIGYQDKTMPVAEISGPVTVELEEAEIGLNQVVISGSKRKEKILDSPSSISVVNAEEIQNNVPLNLFKNIETLPGVDIIPTGLVGGNVVTRGFNNVFSGALFSVVDNRIASVPSLKVNAFQLVPTSTEDIERIEVVRGPASSLYGPNAASGVVHIITKSPLDMPEQFKTKISLAGGLERNVLKGDVWHAGKLNSKVGYKISGNYFQGHNWTYEDPAEPDSIYIYRTSSEGNDTLSDKIKNDRDNFIRSYSIDGRLDYRIKKDMELIFSGGFRNGSNVEMTGLGGSQVIHWHYSYFQTRFVFKDLFVQAYTNFSNSGDTYLLRTGSRVIDHSKLYVGQIQHSYKPIDKLRFTYGFDALLTRPDTEETLNGRNEDDDNINEFGLYLQADYDVTKKISLVGAVRADYHNYIDDFFFSPKAALVYKPNSLNTLRATYNRAFDSPGSTHLGLDVLQGHIPVSGIPIQAIGNTAGFNFEYDNNPYLEGSPLLPQYLTPYADNPALDPEIYAPTNYINLHDPAVNNVVWDEIKGLVANGFKEALTESGSDLAGFADIFVGLITPADIDSTVLNVVKTLNLTTFNFEGTIDPKSINNKKALTNATTQTYEIGYKGTLFNRLMLTVDLYRMDKKNFISPLSVISPNVFLDPVTLEESISEAITMKLYGANGPSDPSDNLDLFGRLTPDDLLPLLDQNPDFGGNNNGRVDDELTAIFVDAAGMLPFGTITPVESEGGEMFITYINVGDVTVYGMDIGATVFVTDKLRLGGAYSWMSKDTIHVKDAQFGYISLNAPQHKVALNGSYNFEKIGLETGLKWRWQQGFLANSGVYAGPVDAYNTLDLNVTYKLHFSRNTEVTLSIQNLIGGEYQPFPGAPKIGRLSMLRISHTF